MEFCSFEIWGSNTTPTDTDVLRKHSFLIFKRAQGDILAFKNEDTICLETLGSDYDTVSYPIRMEYSAKTPALAK